MPIDDDRQHKTNDRVGAEIQFLAAVDAIEVPFEPSTAVVERHEQSRADHEYAKVHGHKAKRNRAISAWRKTDEGKAQRNPKDRKAYEEEQASQGNVVRGYTKLTGLTGDEKAERLQQQNRESQRKRRKNLTESEREQIRRKDRQRKAAKKV